MRFSIGFAFMFVACGGLFAGNVCTWTGGGGDAKWRTAANWDTPPVSGNGDVVVFANAEAGTLVTENDFADLSLACVVGCRGGAVRITGERLLIGKAGAGPYNATSVTNAAETLTFDAPVRFTADNAKIYYGWDVVFNAETTFDANVTKFTTGHIYTQGNAALHSGNLKFNAPVTGPDVTFNSGADGVNPTYFNAPVNLKAIVGGTGWCDIYFRSAGNRYGSITTTFNHLRFTAVNAVDPETMFAFVDNSNNNTYNYGVFWFEADQTLYGFNNPKWTKGADQHLFCCQNASGATLTLRPARDLEGWVRLGDTSARNNLSLVFDPQVVCTQTLHEASHGMNGTIAVKGGTLKFDLGSKLPNVTALTVENGVFETTCTNDAAMFSDKLTLVKIGATGVLRAGSDRGVSPFADGKTLARISEGGVLEVGENVTVRLKSVMYKGAVQAVGTYTATNADWVQGPGSVYVAETGVLASWDAAADGPWAGTGSHWSPNVPTAESMAYVTAEGADYTVDFGSAAVWPAHLEIGQPSGAYRSTVNVATDVNAGAPGVTVARNGVFRMSDGLYAQTNGTFKVEKDGELKVTGGVFRLASTANSSTAFSLKSGARMTVTAGRVELPVTYDTATPVSYPDANGSEIVLSGTGALDFRMTGRRSQPVFRGSVKMTGESQIAFDQPLFECPNGAEKTNVFLFAEGAQALMTESPIVVFGENYNNGGWLVCDFSSTNRFYVNFGARFGTGGNTRVDVHGGGNLTANNFQIALGGTRAATAHETLMVVRDGGTVRKAATQNYDAAPYGMRVREGAVLRAAPGGTVIVGSESGSSGSNGAWFLVGAGDEGGRVEVTGGLVKHYDRFQMLIGAWGGAGTWLQTAGTTSVSRTEVYVGGAVTNLLVGFNGGGNTAKSASTLNNFAARTATGLLRIEGGRFECAKNVIFGLDGLGALEMGASPDARLVAHDLVLTNAAGAAGTGASATFTFGADGVGCAVATNRLVIAAGSKLKVDASALTDSRRSWFPLFAYDSVEGAFDEDDITFVKPSLPSNRGAHIVQGVYHGVSAFWLHVSRGTMLIVR